MLVARPRLEYRTFASDALMGVSTTSPFFTALEPAAFTMMEAAELAAYCRARLATYKVPVRFTFVTALPKTASGKLRRVR